MNAYLYKLISPRPNFVGNMTAQESKFMQEHALYWRRLVEKGIAITFGLVLDPKEAWGVAIFKAEDERGARSIIENDPAVKGGLTFELLPMRSATTQEHLKKN